jgi:hypothetical protein
LQIKKFKSRWSCNTCFLRYRYDEIKKLDKFESEHLCIKINYKNQNLYVITYYSQPLKIIENKMLEEIERIFKIISNAEI